MVNVGELVQQKQITVQVMNSITISTYGPFN